MKPVQFIYKNHRGETRLRTVTPTGLEFQKLPGFSYRPGWFLTGYDHDKEAVRSFRLSHIVPERETQAIRVQIKLA